MAWSSEGTGDPSGRRMEESVLTRPALRLLTEPVLGEPVFGELGLDEVLLDVDLGPLAANFS